MPDPFADPNRVLASLVQRGLSLELHTLDLCFLAALHVRAEHAGLAAFQEDQLADIFEQVCGVIEPNGEAPRKRATPALRRLREQRLLTRVDGAGVVRAGEYALSRLATGIVEFFLQEEALTRESLTLLTATLVTTLEEVRAFARSAQSAEAWQKQVVGPLRVTIGDLVGGIERRQRGFDVQQEGFRREIGSLLQVDWFGALERCQLLLENTTVTLRELSQVLLRDTQELLTLLQDIQELAVAADNTEAEAATRAVAEQVDRARAWGAARQRAWSDYYQYVHRFLRDVVRLDPARGLAQRLREQLAGRYGRPFALRVAAEPGVRLLRAVMSPVEKPPVKRPRKERDSELADEVPRDPQRELEIQVEAALTAGAEGLGAVTRGIIEPLAEEERFATAGRIAGAVARLREPEARAERAWVPAADGLLIEEWQIPPDKGSA